MTSYEGWRRPQLITRLTLALCAVALAPLTARTQSPGTENVLCTCLGGDAEHMRYTPADGITADNCVEMTLLRRFNAASFGPSTPLQAP